MRSLSRLLLVAGALLPATVATGPGCGGDLCEDARTAFCEKACDCDGGPCVIQFGAAAFQYFDSVQDCIDVAGNQICDPEAGEERADACITAVADMASCGGEVAPEICTVKAPGSPSGTTVTSASSTTGGGDF